MEHDNDIVARILAGDKRRFGVLVDRYKDRALTLACRLLGSNEEGEEVLQDAFLKAFYALPGFRGDARFGTWFYRIVYNSCMTRLSRRREAPVSLDGEMHGDDGASALPDTGTMSILERLEEEEMQTIMAEEMGRLPERFRAVLTLFYVQGQRYEEIAQILGEPLGTVKTHLSRGRALLRERVASRYNDTVRAA
jgi:RNA polymerase sigma-70 factor (ECF subfamily)